MLRKLNPLFWKQKTLSIASWHQRVFIFLLLEGGKAGQREVERGGQGSGRMKSTLCGSALPGAIKAREKPKTDLCRGVFSAEVIAARPFFSFVLSPLLGGPGFPQENLPCPRCSHRAVLCCVCLFWGQSHWGHGSTRAGSSGQDHRDSPTPHPCAQGSCKAPFLQKAFEKTDIW